MPVDGAHPGYSADQDQIEAAPGFAIGYWQERARTSGLRCLWFIDYTKKAVEMDNDHIVTVTADEVVITDYDGNPQGRALILRTLPLPRRLTSFMEKSTTRCCRARYLDGACG